MLLFSVAYNNVFYFEATSEKIKSVQKCHDLCIYLFFSVWFQFFAISMTYFLCSLLPVHQLLSLHLCSVTLSCCHSLITLPTVFKLLVFFTLCQILIVVTHSFLGGFCFSSLLLCSSGLAAFCVKIR